MGHGKHCISILLQFSVIDFSWAVLPTLKASLEMIALLILHHQHLEYIMELMVEILVLVQDLAHFFQFVLMRMGRIRMVFKLLMSTIVAILVLDLVT